MPKSYLIYKPYLMLSQFTKEHDDHITLADLDFNFTKDIYPLGRLDRDSEGLLILTNDRKKNALLLDPSNSKPKTYTVQVEGVPTLQDISLLEQGIELRIKKKIHKTRPAKITLLKEPPNLPERRIPIRFRKNIPTSWLTITLTEGKNRQVRRMFAHIGTPVLRLVRTSILKFTIGKGELKEIKSGDVLPITLSI